MKTIVKDGIHCHSDFWLLPDAYLAITLFGHVFFNMKYNDLVVYLENSFGKVTINHERIHILQANSFKTKYLGFYAYYIWYWIVGLFKYGFNQDKAYRSIPFEREAYEHEQHFNYSETHWRDYVHDK